MLVRIECVAASLHIRVCWDGFCGGDGPGSDAPGTEEVGRERAGSCACDPRCFRPSTIHLIARCIIVSARALHAQCSWTAPRIGIRLGKAIPSMIHGQGRVQAGHAVGSCGAVETATDGSVLLPCSPRASRRLYVWKRVDRTLCVRVRSGVGWFLDSAFLHVGEEGHLGFGHGFALSCTHAPVPLGRFPFVCGGVDVVLWADTARHLLLCFAICTCPIHPCILGFHFLPSRQVLAPSLPLPLSQEGESSLPSSDGPRSLGDPPISIRSCSGSIRVQRGPLKGREGRVGPV